MTLDVSDGLSTVSWLFTRGRQSVRLTRRTDTAGNFQLEQVGPDDECHRFEFPDVISCMSHQASVERQLVAEGYSLEQHTIERRSGQDRRTRTRTDRRRGELRVVG